MTTGENKDVPIPIKHQRQWQHRQTPEQRLKTYNQRHLEKHGIPAEPIHRFGQGERGSYQRRKEMLIKAICNLHKLDLPYQDGGW